MLVCNTCGRNEDEVKIIKKRLIFEELKLHLESKFEVCMNWTKLWLGY